MHVVAHQFDYFHMYCLIDQGSTATAAPATPWRRHRNPSCYCSPLSPLLISSLMRCSVSSSFLKPPRVKFDREKETPAYISSDVQAGGCGDGIWFNEMKKGVDVKYENDGRILCYMAWLADVGWQNKPHHTVGREKLMRGPTECWSAKNAMSHSRSGKAHDSPNGLLVGKEYSDR
ncbi:unnamed protein product [Triticum turgidum subsp. durum]|uniref:Uncharacterized protein n=1 Tax=Triticum turgidum subsp. durum TaxID=4567 RepID=A0A9R1ADR9_TRITD|nr:unnamed protein product [Triticum turgidum subsp. durum]